MLTCKFSGPTAPKWDKDKRGEHTGFAWLGSVSFEVPVGNTKLYLRAELKWNGNDNYPFLKLPKIGQKDGFFGNKEIMAELALIAMKARADKLGQRMSAAG